MLVSSGLSGQVSWRSDALWNRFDSSTAADGRLQKKNRSFVQAGFDVGKEKTGRWKNWASGSICPKSVCIGNRRWASQLLGIAGVILVCSPASAVPLVMRWQPETTIYSTQANFDASTVESILARQLALRFREMNDEELIEVLEQLLRASRASSILSQAEAIKMKSVDIGKVANKVHMEATPNKTGRASEAATLPKDANEHDNNVAGQINGGSDFNEIDMGGRTKKALESTSKTSTTEEGGREGTESTGSGVVETKELDMTGLLLEGWRQQLQDSQQAQLQGGGGETENPLKDLLRQPGNESSLLSSILGIRKAVSSLSQQAIHSLLGFPFFQQKNAVLYMLAATGFLLMISLGRGFIISRAAKILRISKETVQLKKGRFVDEKRVGVIKSHNQNSEDDAELSRGVFSQMSRFTGPAIFGRKKDSLKTTGRDSSSIYSGLHAFFHQFLVFTQTRHGQKGPRFSDKLREKTALPQQNPRRHNTKAVSAPKKPVDLSGNDVGKSDSNLRETNEPESSNSRQERDLPNNAGRSIISSLDDSIKLGTRDVVEVQQPGISRGDNSFIGISFIKGYGDVQSESYFLEVPSMDLEASNKCMQTDRMEVIPADSMQDRQADLNNQDVINTDKARSRGLDWVGLVGEDDRLGKGERKQKLEQQTSDVKGIKEESEVGCTSQRVTLDCFFHEGLLWVRDTDGVFVKQDINANSFYSRIKSEEEQQDKTIRYAQLKRKSMNMFSGTPESRSILEMKRVPAAKSSSVGSKKELRSSRLSTVKGFDYRQLQLREEYRELRGENSPKSF